MSVDLEQLIIEAGQDARNYVTTPRWTGSVKFDAGALRKLKLQVGFDPLPQNPCHGEVWGLGKEHPRSLLTIAAWFVEIPGVALTDGKT